MLSVVGRWLPVSSNLIKFFALRRNGTITEITENLSCVIEKKPLPSYESKRKFEIRCPRGTRDYGPQDMAIREQVLSTVTECFKRHGAVTIDTPVFELRDILLGKYGEEGGKLIYDLSDQGGELLSLRYDLTVPFARYLAMNKTVVYLKRYHIGKVYRRDNPSRGRFREFYQCDFDIAGSYDLMIPEAELLRIVNEILNALDVGAFEIKVNHKLLLDGMFAVCGVPKKHFKDVCSSIDKLDKLPWEDIRNELCNEKQIHCDIVSKLETYVCLREHNSSLTNFDLLNWFEKDEATSKNNDIQKAVSEMKQLLEYCELFGVLSTVIIEPSLARGLDYYTGAIFEVTLKNSGKIQMENSETDEETRSMNIGSVAGGGRYDNLVSMFLPKHKVPCVGISIGIERLFTIMKEKSKMEHVRSKDTQVLVASAQKKLVKERMKICRLLWDNNIKAEMALKANPKMLDQMQYCEEHKIPLAIIVGERELEEGILKLRDVPSRAEQDIPRDNLVEELERRLQHLQ
ncbi:histidyl-tRNA synthetase, variant [Loa loa]|uniref:histidine--tRNA ligase n=1 Tax=Loa loa TaxID=7209 RepID=A0A1S0UIW9_LOALO|nr:histidyl-tRNA synthetase, variant [Loa loa]EJD74764.1 histidyl-tRNA synthetase, variant [Loa loa]